MSDSSASVTPAPDGGSRPSRRHPWLRLLRVHHWLKNVLLAVPFLTAQAWSRPGALAQLALGFLAFSLVASASYVLNDLADVAHDREHALKRLRSGIGTSSAPACLEGRNNPGHLTVPVCRR